MSSVVAIKRVLCFGRENRERESEKEENEENKKIKNSPFFFRPSSPEIISSIFPSFLYSALRSAELRLRHTGAELGWRVKGECFRFSFRSWGKEEEEEEEEDEEVEIFFPSLFSHFYSPSFLLSPSPLSCELSNRSLSNHQPLERSCSWWVMVTTSPDSPCR